MTDVQESTPWNFVPIKLDLSFALVVGGLVVAIASRSYGLFVVVSSSILVILFQFAPSKSSSLEDNGDDDRPSKLHDYIPNSFKTVDSTFLEHHSTSSLEHSRLASPIHLPRCTVTRKARLGPSMRNQLGGSCVWPSRTTELPLRSREYFHCFLNEELYPQARDLADEYVAPFLEDARVYMQRDDDIAPVPDLCTFFEYDVNTFEAHMMTLYDKLMKVCYLDWQDHKYPPKWYAHSKASLVNYLTSEAPFHLTDGAWLRGIAPVGVIKSYHAKLISIWADEVGNGSIEMNHCNTYDAVLKSAGVSLPSVESVEFMNQDCLLDECYTNPTFALALSLQPRKYFPEILGETLFLELSSASLHAPLAKELKRNGLDPQFSRLHTSIDNPASGHARQAIEAIVSYMDQYSLAEDKDRIWRRIWTGFVAYAISGGYQSQLQEQWQQVGAESPREQVVALFRSKARFAATAHGNTRLAGTALNKWFESPEELVDALAQSKWITPGDVSSSSFVTKLCGFEGCMFKVFTTEELTKIKTWIESLKEDNKK